MKFKYIILFVSILVGNGYLSAQTGTRKKTSINAHWKFHKGDYENVIYRDFDDSDWERVNIPHTWNAEDVLDDPPGYYRGICWYRKEFNVNPAERGRRVWLFFEGANQDAIVYVNGKYVGEHHGGYTAFSIDITDHVKYEEKNLLAVRLNNDWNPNIPPLGGDLCHFGGIYRDVYVITMEPVHFDMDLFASPGIMIDAPGLSEEQAIVRIRGKVKNDDDKSRKLAITHHVLDPGGEKVAKVETEMGLAPDEDTWFKLKTPTIKDPLLWSPELPALYKLKSAIRDAESGELLDEVTNSFGLKWIAVDADKGFLLNGEPYFIKGIGKHQDYKDIGYAVPDEINHLDIKLIKEMGGNMVRGHYQFDPVTYEACDELGVMTIPRLPVLDKINHTEAFAEGCKHMLKEMIYQNFNHPSVIIWEYFNEVFGDMDWYWEKPQDPEEVKKNLKATYELSVELENLVRRLDSTRLTEYVFHTDPTPEWYKEAGLTDLSFINGWNLYQGWYHNSLDSVGRSMDRFRKYNPEVGYIVSEFGAGSDPRIHTYEPTIFDFSIEYQEKFHQVYLEEIKSRPWVAGLCIWTLFDFQVDTRADAVPHINSKGLLAVDRKPKNAYFLYQAHWSDKPMVHISAEHWNKRIERVDGANFDTHENIAEREITVYSNVGVAELFHNGNSLGQKDIKNHMATWEVPFEQGVNQLEAKVVADDKVIKDYKEIEVSFLPDNMREFGFPGNNLCINVGQSRTYFMDDLTRNYWLHDQKYKENNFGHKNGRYYRIWNNMEAWQGIREGVGQNIKETNIDPVFQTFLVGVEDYQVDVPDGKYEVTLYFAEPFSKERRLDPKEKTGADGDGNRVFNVKINNTEVFHELNLADEYGESTAVKECVCIEAKDGKGISINLEPVKGEPVLCGVKVVK